MGSTVYPPAEIALHPRTHQDLSSLHLRLLLPLRHPAVQGGLRHHGRRQGRSTVVFRPSGCICCLWQECWWGRDPGHARRSGRTNELTQMVTLFASKMAGGSDDDDVILASFECFENDGKIDADTFRHSLMTFGVKFSASEVDDAFAEMKIDDGQIDAAHLKGLMVAR